MILLLKIIKILNFKNFNQNINIKILNNFKVLYKIFYCPCCPQIQNSGYGHASVYRAD